MVYGGIVQKLGTITKIAGLSIFNYMQFSAIIIHLLMQNVCPDGIHMEAFYMVVIAFVFI